MSEGTKDKVCLLIFLVGGSHYRVDCYADAAHDCLNHFRKYILFKTSRPEDFERHCEERGGPPWVSYFGKLFTSIKPEDIASPETIYNQIDWIVDFSHVSAMRIFTYEELNESKEKTT